MGVSGSRGATISTSKNSSGACAPLAPSRQASRILLLNWRASSKSSYASSEAPSRLAPRNGEEKRGFGPVDRGWGAEASDRRSGRACSRGLGGRSRGSAGLRVRHPSFLRPPGYRGASRPRTRRWKLTVSGLALVGLAMIGAVFALKGRVPGMPKDPPFIAAAQGPTKVQPPTDQTVTASNDPSVSVLKDNAKPGTEKSSIPRSSLSI